jgi:hypothetical protein
VREEIGSRLRAVKDLEGGKGLVGSDIFGKDQEFSSYLKEVRV